MAEPKRYRIKGNLKVIVDEIAKDHLRFSKECKDLCDEYKFNEVSYTYCDFASGKKLTGFASPQGEVDRTIFRKPNKHGVYIPYVKAKEINQKMENVKPWSLEKLWKEIGKKSCPFEGNMGIYQDKKLDNEMLFYSYNDSFEGHEDLEEIKKSEYYRLIGE